jgi:TM2 domain-containing membrane protein YozV
MNEHMTHCPMCAYPFMNVVYGESLHSRNVVILLCFFGGVLGLHRFYLKRYMSGALMLFTLGGFGIWLFVDFFYFFFFDYLDLQNTKVTRHYNRYLLFLVPIFIGLSVCSLFYPLNQYEKMRRLENRSTGAMAELMAAQRLYKDKTGFYALTIEELQVKHYLAEAPEISYGELYTFQSLDGRDCYRVSLRHDEIDFGLMANSCGKTFKVRS